MTAPTEHPRRVLPAAGASDRGASSPSSGRAEFTPDRYRRAEGQIGPLWEPVNRRRLPSGWWVIPAAVLGLAGWAVALWAVL